MIREENEVFTKSGDVLSCRDISIGLLRYKLFWDNIPFCTMTLIEDQYHGKGYGRLLLEHWENDMR